MANIKYDSEVDILDIHLQPGKYEESEEIEEGVIVDKDKEGNILSIEILDFKKRVKTFPVAVKKTNSHRS